MLAEPVLSLAVSVAAERGVQGVLNTIVRGLAAQPYVALARIWLALAGDICDSCFLRPSCANQSECLHLMASAGNPSNSPGEDWTFLQGHFRRIPLNSSKVGQVGTSEIPILIKDFAAENDWIVRPDWATREGIRSFVGHPLVFQGKILGVLALFSRECLSDQDSTWLGIFAKQAAVAIANARAFEEIARLQTQLELENAYLNENIEDRKRAEDDLQRTAFYLDEGQRLAHSGSWSFTPSGICDYWSQELYHILGFDATKGIPTIADYLNIVHPEDRRIVEGTIERMAAEGIGCDLKKRVIRPDGELRVIRCVGQPVRENGVVTRFIGTLMDITEQERMTEELRRKEAYLAEAQKLSQTGSFGWSVSRGEVFWSEETFRIFEYDRSTCKPTVDLILQRVHPENLPLVQQTIDHAAKGNDFDLEHRLLMPDGSVKDVHVVAHAARDELGNIECIGAVTDITLRKRAQQRLVMQHTVTQLLAEAATLEEAAPKILAAICECLAWDLGALWRTDRAAGLLRCVKVWHKESLEATQFVTASRDMTFMPGIGLPGRVWSSREPAYIPDVVQDSNFLRAPIAAHEGLHAAFAFPILLGSEVVGVMDFLSREIRQPDQDLLDMMATIGSQIGQFIERKRTVEELRRSEAYLAEAQRLSLTGSFGWNTATEEIFWSEETFRILEYDRLVRPNLELVLQRVHPEDRTFCEDLLHRARQERKDLDFEHRLLMPDGSIKYMHVVTHAIRNELDQIEFVGAVTDITATKIAEQRIQQDERDLRQILDLTPQHIGVLAHDGTPLYANRAVLEYFGVTLDQWCSKDSRYDLVHPDDREHLLSEEKKGILEGVSFQFETRFLRHDGIFRWFLVRLSPLKDERGHITRWYGTAVDIEDRKRVEDEIKKENIALREEIDKVSMFEEIVGSSAALRKVLSELGKVAPTDSTVLITGETGTGKELIARAIHKRSRRSSRAFISVNCAAIPQSLIASELFGHEKGAFTGALQRRLGRFELAEGGTIFLDEIGDLPADTQTALLRVLQEREFERVGGTEPIRADVRVIAATNRDLKIAMNGGAFRSDLYYRLNVFPIEIPALRERKDDIPMLVKYFTDRYANKEGKRLKSIDKRSLALLQSYPWPGNIRELQNVIERAVIVCETDMLAIDENWLSQERVEAHPASGTLSEELLGREKARIEAALAQAKGRVSGPRGAATNLGIPRSTLDSKIRSLKIDKSRFKSA
ncbi:MAG TPA: sigma 54-interacting transcriptional regulator [Candidatus Binatia bacterium]|jgi:formate hydrogenlyase transcriptional activator